VGRTHPVPSLLAVTALVALALAGRPSADLPPETTDPAEAEQWNQAWDDYATQPLDPRSARRDELVDLPGADDSLAATIAGAGSSSPSDFLAPYLRIDRLPRMTWRTRASLADPDAADRWRRAATHGRFRFTDGDAWDGGLVIERDSGEPGVVDYASGALGYRSADGRRTFVLGHARAHVGTGLLASRAGVPWLSLDAVRPRSPSLSATLAATESGEPFGAATLLRGDRWDLLVLVARPRWDATMDTVRGVATTLRTDGTHVTNAERRARHVLAEERALVHAGWMPADGAYLGASAVLSRFSMPVRLALVATKPTRRLAFLGVDARLDGAAWSAWGEAVRDARGSAGLVAGAEYRLLPATLVLAGWSYDPTLVLPYGAGWSFRGEATDEQAVLAGLRLHRGRFRAEALGARWRQTHATRLDSLPREGRWEEVRLGWREGRGIALSARWKQKATWQPGLGGAAERARSEWLAECTLSRGRWTVRPRIDVVDADPAGSGVLAGARVAADIAPQLALGAHLAAYRSTDADAALYLYDLRAPGYGAISGLYDTGIAWGVRLGSGPLAGARGRAARIAWSLAFSGTARRGRGSDLALTAQIDVGWP